MLARAPDGVRGDGDARLPASAAIVVDDGRALNRPADALQPGAVEQPVAVDDAPRLRLDPRIVTVWRVRELWTAALLIGAGLVLSVVLWRLDVRWFFAALPALGGAAAAAADVAIVPGLRWRTWRYDVDPQEVDLQHGWWTVVRTRIPMLRIQHVDTWRGVLERRSGLASLVVYTAAGKSEIPGLALEDANRLRDRIAALANVRDDV